MKHSRTPHQAVPTEHNAFVERYGFTLSRGGFPLAGPQAVRAAIARGVWSWSILLSLQTRAQRRTLVDLLYTHEWLAVRSGCVLGAVTRDAADAALTYATE